MAICLCCVFNVLRWAAYLVFTSYYVVILASF
jgi:hypothetical protein